MCELCEVRSRERCPLRWLEHHSVARGQCRPDAPGGEHQWCIPRRDDYRNTGGIPGDVVGVTACFELRVLEIVHRVVSEVADVHDDAGHDSAAMRAQQRTVVVSLELGELLDVRLDVVGNLVQDRAALLRAQLGPGREGGLGRGDCGIGFGATASADLRDHGAVDGGDRVEGVGGSYPLTPDPVPGINRDAGNGGSRHLCSHSSFGKYADRNSRSFGP